MGELRTGDDVAAALADLRTRAGAPSYAEIARLVTRSRRRRGVPDDAATIAKSTIYDCFRRGRRWHDVDLVLEVVRALDGDADDWRGALAATRAARSEVVPITPGPLATTTALLAREEELERLASLDRSTVIVGLAGIGKTALATEAARRAAARFDVVLTVSLGGFDVDRPPVSTAAVLGEVLRRIAAGRALPTADLLAAYRSALLQRPILLVLDDVADPGQLADLLPDPDGPSRTLVTSRLTLARTPELDDAVLDELHLEEIDADGSLALLRACAPHLAQSEEPDLARLARLTGGHPLALVLAGGRVADRPDWTVSDHVAAYERRSALLELDPDLDVSLGLSYAALDPGSRTALRLVAAAPGVSVSVPSLAALLATSQDEAQRQVRRLTSAHLLRPADATHWACHDVVALFARRRSVEEDPASELDAALDRYLEDQLAQAMRAMMGRLSRWSESWFWLSQDEVQEVRRGATAPDEASAWLDAELANLVAASEAAYDSGRHQAMIRLSLTFIPFLWEAGDSRGALALSRRTLQAAEQEGDERASALAHRYLGQTHNRLADYPAAEHELTEATRLYALLDDRRGLALTHNALAIVASAGGDQTRAITLMDDVVRHYEAAADTSFLLSALNNLATYHYYAGHLDEARDLFIAVAERAAVSGDEQAEQWACSNGSELLALTGDYPRAERAAERALDLATRRRDALGSAYVLAALASVRHQAGQGPRARATAQEALDSAENLQAPSLVAQVLNLLGEIHLAAGEVDRARKRHTEALRLAEEIGEQPEVDRAREALAGSE